MKFWKVKRSLLEVKLLDIRFIFFTVKLAIFSFLAMDQSIIPKGYRNIQKGAHETAQRLGGQLGLAGPIIHAAGPFDQKGRPKW